MRTSTNLAELSAGQLRRAVQLREQIDRLEKQLDSILGGGTLPARPAQAKTIISTAGRARIAAAQRQRWARTRVTPPARPAARGKRVLSPEGRAKIVAAVRARWARERQAQHA